MVEVSIDETKVTFEVKGMDKVWALTSRLEIPWEHIRTVYADPNPAMGWFQGLKLAGADIPNHFRAGLFYQEGNKVFWDVRHPEKTIVVELNDEKYAKLIIEVADPETVLQEVNTAMKSIRAK